MQRFLERAIGTGDQQRPAIRPAQRGFELRAVDDAAAGAGMAQHGGPRQAGSRVGRRCRLSPGAGCIGAGAGGRGIPAGILRQNAARFLEPSARSHRHGLFQLILFGLIAGALAKLIMPGRQGGGFILTVLLGVIGALVGGWMVWSWASGGTLSGFDLRSLGIAIAGALVVLVPVRPDAPIGLKACATAAAAGRFSGCAGGRLVREAASPPGDGRSDAEAGRQGSRAQPVQDHAARSATDPGDRAGVPRDADAAGLLADDPAADDDAGRRSAAAGTGPAARGLLAP